LSLNLAIEVDRELRHARDRLVDAYEVACDRAAVVAHEHAAGDAQVTIEPRVEQHAAVDLDTELRVPLRGILGVGLESQVRAVGVRADDPELPAMRARLRQHEREQVRAARRHEVRARREPIPWLGLVERDEPVRREAPGGLLEPHETALAKLAGTTAGRRSSRASRA